MFSERAKLGLLLALIVGCLCTLLTSHTFLTGERGVMTLNPPLNQFCKIPRLDARACLRGGAMMMDDEEVSTKNKKRHDEDEAVGGDNAIVLSDSSALCAAKLSRATACERAVTRAYRHINMSGCVRELQAATICRLEWCEEPASDGNEERARRDCQKECDPVTEALRSCERGNVDTFMRRAGLHSDGTTHTFR